MHELSPYGKIFYGKQEPILEETKSVLETPMHSWLCLGDFNEVLYHWEKVGGKRAENYRLTAFTDFLGKCSLMDLESKGCAFTLLKDANGEWVKKDQPLKEMTETFFKNLYLSMGARDFQPDPICPICKQEAETTEHALLLCP